MAETEGVIKFSLQFQKSPIEESQTLDELLKWRDVFYRLGAIGQDPSRYEGYAFGNISCRLGHTNKFLISGTQTGLYEIAEPDHFTCVDSFNIDKNSVIAHGPIEPSSESLTHAAIYDLSLQIDCIVHGHIPGIWKSAEVLAIASTPADVPYGTPEMAQAIKHLYKENAKPVQAIFAMMGHEDGVIAYGKDFESIEKLLRDK